jgi:ABC-type polysaccharide/polyol phosphate export permease
MGELWEILNPLINMIVMVLVFGQMFGHGKVGLFPLYVLTGTTILGLFTSGTTACLYALSGNKGFLIKTQLKKSIYVLEKVLLAFRNFLYSLIIYAFVLAYYRLAPDPTWLYVLPDIFLLLIMMLGMGKLLAVINVSFADITYFYKIFTLMMLYGSAIFYQIDRMPSYVQAVMVINPIYTSITIARTAIMDKAGSPPVMWAVMAVYAAGCYALGTYVFNKEAEHIVERL